MKRVWVVVTSDKKFETKLEDVAPILKGLSKIAARKQPRVKRKYTRRKVK